MKYTRYNINKGKSNSTTILIFIVGIILVSILFGSILSKILMQDGSIKSGEKKGATVSETMEPVNDDTGENSSTGQPVIKPVGDNDESKSNDNKVAIVESNGIFTILQCGAFSSEENADTLKGQLVGFGSPFIVKVGDINKVVLGVYSSSTIDATKEKLEKANMDFSSNKISLSTEDKCDKQISLILNGNLRIISEIEQDGASSVKTKTIKEWLNTLAQIDKSEPNYKNLIELKEYTSKLPETITKENLMTIKEYLYSFVLKFDEAL